MAELTLTFFRNHNDSPIGDLYLDERRLLATNHPATFVAAMWLMDRKRLKVVASGGSRTGLVLNELEGTAGIVIANLQFQRGCARYQWADLGEEGEEKAVLQGLDLFQYEDWGSPQLPERAQEHLYTALHHLPSDVIKKRPAGKPPKRLKSMVRTRNKWVYFPEC